MDVNKLLGIGLLMIASTAVPAAAQEMPEPGGPQRVWFSALDRGQLPVPGLTAGDFRLRINGRVSPLEGFRAGNPGGDRSVLLVAWILLDFNPNINAAVIAGQAAAAANLLSLLHADSAVGVKIVSNQAEILTPLGSSAQALSEAFTAFRKRRTELRVRAMDAAQLLGPGGMLRAAELALPELRDYAASRPALSGREIHQVLILISDGNINPGYNRKPLLEAAARQGVFLYPIFVPRASYGRWLDSYFELGEKSGGLGMIFGALQPGSDIYRLPRENSDPNALTFNFMNLLRDLNGKYSFEAPEPPPGGRLKLDLKCLQRDVSVRLPLHELP